MKKRIFKVLALFVAVILTLQSFAFADGSDSGIFNVTDFGEFKIVYTNRVGTGRGPNSYWYRNCAVVDSDGNFLTEPIYSEILPPSEGRAAFVLDGKIGFFDENWNVVIEPKYFCNVYPLKIKFSEGLAAIGKMDEQRYIVWGFIDRDGNEVIDFIYDSAQNFENGTARVGLEEGVYNYNTKMKTGKIDKDGNLVEPFKFSYYWGNEYLWENETLDVILSENLVELNGRRYENADLEYPFINYHGISYIPLSYYGCRMMGINCDWTPEEGVMLSGGGEMAEDIVGKNGMKSGVYQKAKIYKGKLSVNGKVYEYGDTSYPLITFRNVVYMPVLWQTGMEALGIDYKFLRADQIGGEDGCMVFETK